MFKIRVTHSPLLCTVFVIYLKYSPKFGDLSLHIIENHSLEFQIEEDLFPLTKLKVLGIVHF